MYYLESISCCGYILTARDCFVYPFLILMRPAYSQYTVISVLRFFDIRYTYNYVKHLLEENSDGENLWGILTVLQIYGLIVEPRRVVNQMELVDADFNKPFITEYDNDILLIKKITGNVVVGCCNGKDTMYSKDEFFANWSGIIISIRKGVSVGEPNLNRHLRFNLYIWLSRIAIILSILIMSIYKMVSFGVPFYIGICFILSILGAIIAYHIEQSHYSPYGLLNSLCSLIKRSSCNQIIVGKSRYITALGFSYFCSLCVFILLPLDNYTLIICITAISLIEVIWSLLLQLKKRAFCINCTIVQLIVVTMALICIPNLAELHLPELIQQGLLFLSILTIIFIVSAFQIWPYIANQYKFKAKSRNADYFKKKYLDSSISSEKSDIKVFFNPFCSSCKKEIMESYNLLVNQGKSKVTPIIIASDLQGEKAGMSIISGEEPFSIFYRLKEWYSWGYQNPMKFERNYWISIDDETKFVNVLKDNWNLAHACNVQYTPSIICNGIKLPTGISLVDVLTL